MQQVAARGSARLPCRAVDLQMGAKWGCTTAGAGRRPPRVWSETACSWTLRMGQCTICERPLRAKKAGGWQWPPRRRLGSAPVSAPMHRRRPARGRRLAACQPAACRNGELTTPGRCYATPDGAKKWVGGPVQGAPAYLSPARRSGALQGRRRLQPPFCLSPVLPCPCPASHACWHLEFPGCRPLTGGLSDRANLPIPNVPLHPCTP